MKILHTADIHLDRAFEGLGKIPAGLADQLSKVNQTVFQELVDLAIKEEVDAVLIAGDTFHQTRVSIQVQAFFVEQLQRLAKQNIPVVMIFGNHDFVQTERFWFAFPKNVLLLDEEKIETAFFKTKTNERVAVSGFSYHHHHLSKNLLKDYPSRASDVDYHIGIYHGEMEQSKEHNFAPFKLSDMKRKNYDYWALGHVHKPNVLNSAEPMIAYSGTIQGHTRKEKEFGGAWIVEWTNGKISSQLISCAQVLWDELIIDLSEISSLELLLPAIEGQVSQITNSDNLIHLVQIRLSNGDKLQPELDAKLESGELLYHLQEKIYQISKGKTWVFDLSVESFPENRELPLGLNENLIEQLTLKYSEEKKFRELVSPLLQQKELLGKLKYQREEREKIVDETLSTLLDTLVIKREER